MAKWGKVVKHTLSPVLVKWWLHLFFKKKGFSYSCNPDLTVWVSGHVCVCVCLCHRVHVSVYVTYMQACAWAFWLSVHVCMCVPQARQSTLLLGSSPLSPQRPQRVWVQVCDQSHVDQSWCQGSSGSDSHSPLYLSLSLCLPLPLISPPVPFLFLFLSCSYPSFSLTVGQ